MNLESAIDLLGNPVFPNKSQQWADLGCGAGLFTKALATILPYGSRVTAIDKDSSVLEQIPALFQGVTIETEAVDFTMLPFPPGLDGILMANSLHYLSDAKSFLEKLLPYLISTGQLLIIEYDREDSNPWVPYPVSFQKMQEICKGLGLELIKQGERDSRYGSTMYSVLIKRST